MDRAIIVIFSLISHFDDVSSLQNIFQKLALLLCEQNVEVFKTIENQISGIPKVTYLSCFNFHNT